MMSYSKSIPASLFYNPSSTLDKFDIIVDSFPINEYREK